MKIFAIYAKVELTKKPEWLDGFRAKYDEPYEYHITLKQPCVVDETFVPEIKSKLADLFNDLKIPEHKIVLNFNSLNINKESHGRACIMIDAEKNEELITLKKNILFVLNDYKDYFKEKYKLYEQDSSLHITIGRSLDEEALAKASEELKQDYTCEGEITEVVLGVVQNKTVKEANDPKNQTVFKL